MDIKTIIILFILITDIITNIITNIITKGGAGGYSQGAGAQVIPKQ